MIGTTAWLKQDWKEFIFIDIIEMMLTFLDIIEHFHNKKIIMP